MNSSGLHNAQPFDLVMAKYVETEKSTHTLNFRVLTFYKFCKGSQKYLHCQYSQLRILALLKSEHLSFCPPLVFTQISCTVLKFYYSILKGNYPSILTLSLKFVGFFSTSYVIYNAVTKIAFSGERTDFPKVHMRTRQYVIM